VEIPSEPPDWISDLAGVSAPVPGRFGPLQVWTATTVFRVMPDPPPPVHELNCRKGSALLFDAEGQVSCAEVETARLFRAANWSAGWLATCGRRNQRWLEFMYAVAPPATSSLPKPLPLVPGRVASILARHGSSYPDIVAWRQLAHPVFMEIKGPDDTGTSQVRWLTAAFDAGTITLDRFVLLRWTPVP
jgi:hypothetical protein